MAVGLVLDLDSDEDMTSFWRGVILVVDLILGLSDLRWNFASIAGLCCGLRLSVCCISWSGTFSVGVRWRFLLSSRFKLLVDVLALSEFSVSPLWSVLAVYYRSCISFGCVLESGAGYRLLLLGYVPQIYFAENIYYPRFPALRVIRFSDSPPSFCLCLFPVQRSCGYQSDSQKILLVPGRVVGLQVLSPPECGLRVYVLCRVSPVPTQTRRRGCLMFQYRNPISTCALCQKVPTSCGF